MKKITFLLPVLFFLLNSFSLNATPTYYNYNWEQSPKPYVLKDNEKNLSEIVLKEKQAVEFVITGTGELAQYELYHKVIKVNSDKSIEEYNRIYIPGGAYLKFHILKARSISPDGKVIELNEKDIKEGTDEESKRTFKFFAIEGLVVGSEVEFIFLTERPASIGGTVEKIQSTELKKNVEFEIIAPSHLLFSTKSYNGLPDFQLDSLTKDKNVWFIRMDEVPALAKEEQSNYYANVQQFIYRIDKNTETNVRNFISYGKISTGIYELIMAPASSQIDKKVKKLVLEMNLKFARDEEDKIRTIEQYVKRNFAILNSSEPALKELSSVLDKKIMNEEGSIRLFAAIFNHLEIDYQIVLTSDRELLRFDPDFEAYTFLSDYLVYFPGIKKYLSPDNAVSCLGFVPHNLTNNYGLFIKKVNLGTYSSAVGKVQFIEPLPYDQTFHNMDISIVFPESIVSPTVKIEQQHGGYYAQYYQPLFSFFPEEEKQKIKESLLKDFVSNMEQVDITIENEGIEYFGIRPFIVKATFISGKTVEKAGTNYLFKIGELIGPQKEMYQEEARKLQVETDFNRNYHREITFEIPSGYKIKNPEALKLNIVFEEEGEKTMGFISDYSIEGNKVKVIIDEYYKKIIYPLDQYEDYRKVINAAADFNKVTLLLEKVQ